MKSSILAFAASAALVSAQATFNQDTKEFNCAMPGGSYCAGDSLATNVIIRCNNGKGQAGNCADNLSGVAPAGNKAEAKCYQSSNTAGDAACSWQGQVYGSNGTTYPVSSSSSGVFAEQASSSATDVASTTSTIYSTQLITVTSCAPTVTSCPASLTQIITSVVVVDTTICPVTEATPGPQPPVVTVVSQPVVPVVSQPVIPVVSQPIVPVVSQPIYSTVSTMSTTYYAIVSQPQYPTTTAPAVAGNTEAQTLTQTVTCTEVHCQPSYTVVPSYPTTSSFYAIVSQPQYATNYTTSYMGTGSPITQTLPQFTGGAATNRIAGAAAAMGLVVAALL
ncbi:MAG: hypothetical protein M1814_005499 [Vezdaea aestivalis]|nr:MAG: hypothetical protein M1814_005499 [Vezdaea aestivalis]